MSRRDVGRVSAMTPWGRTLHVRAGVVAVTVLLLATAVDAWNPAGHMAIASIAYDRLTEPQRQSLVALLRDHPRFGQDFAAQLPAGLSPPEQARWIFMRGAVWPDVARSLTGDDLKTYNHPSWHYVDLPVYLDAQASEKISPPPMELDYRKASSAQTMNVVQALDRAAADLADASQSRAQKAVALCWVLHLVGDIHQPLHGATLYSAARFRGVPIGDRGGNDIPVSDIAGIVVTTEQRKPNLHALWDAMLGTDDSLDAAVKLGDSIVQSHPSKDFEEQLKRGRPPDWARESCQIAAREVYTPEIRTAIEAGEAHPHAPLPPLKISAQYLEAGRRTAGERAALAGYRLSALLAQTPHLAAP